MKKIYSLTLCLIILGSNSASAWIFDWNKSDETIINVDQALGANSGEWGNEALNVISNVYGEDPNGILRENRDGSTSINLDQALDANSSEWRKALLNKLGNNNSQNSYRPSQGIHYNNTYTGGQINQAQSSTYKAQFQQETVKSQSPRTVNTQGQVKKWVPQKSKSATSTNYDLNPKAYRNQSQIGSLALPKAEKFGAEIGQVTDLRALILNTLNWLLSFIGVLCVGVVIYAGFMMILSGGEDGPKDKGKNMIIWAVIGIIVVLSAWAIVETVIGFPGKDFSQTGSQNTYDYESSYYRQTGNQFTGDNTYYGDGYTAPMADGTYYPEHTFNGNNNGYENPFAQNPIIIKGENIFTQGNTTYVSLEEAQKGLQFTIAGRGKSIWNFGDGDTFTPTLDTTNDPSATLTHSFFQERTYIVQAKFQHENGESYSFQKQVIVGGVSPMIYFDPKKTFIERDVEFNANGTTSSVGNVQKYEWSCEGAGCFGDMIGQSIKPQFSTKGLHTVTLTATASTGISGSKSVEVQVLSERPKANFSYGKYPSSVRPGLYRFDGSLSETYDGFNSTGLEYLWEIEGEKEATTGPQTNYEFKTSGSKEVTLIVRQKIQGKYVISEPTTHTVEVDVTIPVDFDIR